MDREKLKVLLKNELGYLPANDAIDILIDFGQEVTYSRGDIMIGVGEMVPDVFIVESGIIRFVDMNGDRERTFGFALAGTVFMSKHSFVMDLPSYYQVEACCESEVLVIKRDAFRKAINESKDLALWMLDYAYGELFYQEHKNKAIHNGTAAERYRSIYADRPEILEKVPQKVIASYLGVTPEYLSKLKRESLKRPH
ncbi:MAG: Crp/Fnr family transcriptional regulator [Muribaculaceae bacterium]|nr:Crp/Fnr family transcriptional regulator [Muribaculaceae bacterium]